MNWRMSLVAVVLLFVISPAIHSQEMKPAKTEESETKSGQRLPNNYGKLGLSDEQRQKIYGIQAGYRQRIESLLQELEDLRNQETLEIQSTLTSAQQAELLKLLEEARKKREARKKGA